MNLSEAVLSVPALMIAVILHEVAHGWVAEKMGDPTARYAGRLTLNPLPHIDPFGTILLPAMFIILGSPVIFGWAKPVPINPMNFHDLRRGTFFVSIAGVVMNISLALLGGLLYHLIKPVLLVSSPFVVESILFPLLVFLEKLVLINLILALFNIVPIPPLDGSKALMSFLSFKYWEVFYRYEMYGFLIIALLLFTGILQSIIYPPLVFLYNLILTGL